jgi:hypothetical protein
MLERHKDTRQGTILTAHASYWKENKDLKLVPKPEKRCALNKTTLNNMYIIKTLSVNLLCKSKQHGASERF